MKEIKQTQLTGHLRMWSSSFPSERHLAKMGSADKTVMVFRSHPKIADRKHDRHWKETLFQMMNYIYFILILIFHWREGQNLHLNGNI